MESLHPLSPLSTGGRAVESGPVTVLVNRTVPPTQEHAFHDTLKELLRDFDRFPGTCGSMVFRREVAEGVEFSILQQFAGKAEHDAWAGSPGFSRWIAEVAPPQPTPGHVRHYSGMDAFFVSARAPDAPPRWKMAVLLMLAVYPPSLVLSIWGAPVLARMPVLAGTFLTSVLMVFLMTYVLVPILTKLFQWWLQPAKRRNGEGSQQRRGPSAMTVTTDAMGSRSASSSAIQAEPPPTLKQKLTRLCGK